MYPAYWLQKTIKDYQSNKVTCCYQHCLNNTCNDKAIESRIGKPGINFIDAAEENHFTMNTIADNQKGNNQQGTLQAVGGLLLTGAGLSMANDAGAVRAKGGKWFWYGTLALIVFQAGLCLVVSSTRYEQQT